MNDIKFNCPQCGQHLVMDATGAGARITCPQCGQAIVVPSSPAMANPPAPKVPERSAMAKKKLPVVLVATLALVVCLVALALFVFRENFFNSTPPPKRVVRAPKPAVVAEPSKWPVVEVPPDLPLPEGTNYWTLNVKSVGTPAVPAGGKVHGTFFTAAEIHLNSDGLTLRTPQLPPDAGVTIYLYANPIESLYGKSLLYESDTSGAPGVFLRWKGATEMKYKGYSLRLEFGNPESNYIPGKIYLCADDEMKSYVVGKFNARIDKP